MWRVLTTRLTGRLPPTFEFSNQLRQTPRSRLGRIETMRPSVASSPAGSRRHERDRGYLTVTAIVAVPPALLTNFTFCGFTDTVNDLLYTPPPWFVSVPISWFVDVTNACNVAVELVLVAPRRSRLVPTK